jgi:hypothetical protein
VRSGSFRLYNAVWILGGLILGLLSIYIWCVCVRVILATRAMYGVCYVGQGLLGLYMACWGILESLGSRMRCELEFEIRSILGFIWCVCVCVIVGY